MKYDRLLCPTDCSQDRPISINAVNIKSHPWHIHNKFEIIYLLEGSLDAHILFYKNRMNAGDFILVNEDVPHMLISQNDNKAISYHFDFDFFENYIPNLKDYIFIASESQTKSADIYSDTVKTLLKQIASLYFTGNEYAAEQITDKASSLFSLLVSHFSNWQQKHNVISPGASFKKPVQFERLNRILNYIYDHYSEKITLETIARQEYLNKYYISHIFTEGLGMSFQNYLALARVEIAHYMLLSTDFSLSEISERCGFSNPRSFRQVYIEYTGKTPQETRTEASGFTIEDVPLIEANLFDSISPEYFVQSLHASQQIKVPDFSGVNKPEIRHIQLDMHKMIKKSKSVHMKTAVVNTVQDMFSYDFEETAAILHRFSFESVSVYAKTLIQFRYDFKGFDALIPVLRILKEHKLYLNILGADAELKTELAALYHSDDRNVPITFGAIPDTTGKLPASATKSFSLTEIMFGIFNNEIAPPDLYPNDEKIYLMRKNNLKSRYFYMFSALSNMKDNILENTPECIITFNKNNISILLTNDGTNTIRYLFKLQAMASDYICRTTTLSDLWNNEDGFLPVDIEKISKDIHRLIEIKCFPPTEISFISQTPEHHLYVTVKPKSAMYIELTETL